MSRKWLWFFQKLEIIRKHIFTSCCCVFQPSLADLFRLLPPLASGLHCLTMSSQHHLSTRSDTNWKLYCSWSFLVDSAVVLINYTTIQITNYWSMDWLVGWLRGWASWLIDWLINWLVDWLIDCVFGWCVCWLFDWLVVWLVDWLTDWLTDNWLIDRLIDRLTDWLLVLLEEMRKDDQQVKYLWEVLENFSNEDRSRFLRFVTGRRRLPAVMHVVGESVSFTI